jgi:hypothetical protein
VCVFCVRARRKRENEKWLSARAQFLYNAAHMLTCVWRIKHRARLFWRRALLNFCLIPGADDDGSFCPQVFDGWSCWARTAAGSVAESPCPYFITGFDPSSEYWFLRLLPTSRKGSHTRRERDKNHEGHPELIESDACAKFSAQMVLKFSTASTGRVLILEIYCVRGISSCSQNRMNRRRCVSP